MKKYYLAVNFLGFANSWKVLVFKTQKKRDYYYDTYNAPKCIKIKRCEVTSYARLGYNINEGPRRPKPFSGEFWGIYYYPHDETAPIIDGVITISHDNDPSGAERLF